jgi:hypothetical protein
MLADRHPADEVKPPNLRPLLHPQHRPSSRPRSTPIPPGSGPRRTPLSSSGPGPFSSRKGGSVLRRNRHAALAHARFHTGPSPARFPEGGRQLRPADGTRRPRLSIRHKERLVKTLRPDRGPHEAAHLTLERVRRAPSRRPHGTHQLQLAVGDTRALRRTSSLLTRRQIRVHGPQLHVLAPQHKRASPRPSGTRVPRTTSASPQIQLSAIASAGRSA